MRLAGRVSLGFLLSTQPAAHAFAAEPLVAFHVPAASRAEALIQFALQADLSLVTPGACGGQTAPLSAVLTRREALRRLLAGSGCSFEFVEAGVVRIYREPQRPGPARVEPPPPEVSVAELVVTTPPTEAHFEKGVGSASLVRESQISAMGATDAQDLGPVVGGLATTNLGPGRNKVMLRGLSDGVFTGRTQSSVGIFLDNVPLTRNAPNPDLRLSDIRRVEVARGPQGALYGAGALAGLYRMVPNPPELGALSAEVSAGWSATQHGPPSRSADLMLNAPLVRDRLALRLVGYSELRGGYVHGGQPSSPSVDRTLRNGGRAALRFQISSDWRLDVAAAAQTLSTADTHYVLSTYRRPHLHHLAEAHHNTLREAAVTVNGAGDWGSFTSTTGLVSHSFSSDFDAADEASSNSPPAGFARLFLEAAQTRLITQDTILRSPEGQRMRWLAGAYFGDISERTTSWLQVRCCQAASKRLFDKVRRDRTFEAALYGDLAYDLGADWTARVGLRAFQSRIDHRSLVSSGQGAGLRHVELPFGGLSPSASVRHAFTPSAAAYVLYSEGYRLGGANAISLDGRQFQPLTFSPDRLQNYEVGVDYRALEGRLWVRAAAFYDAWRHVQSDQYTWAGSPYTINIGDVRDRGLSFEGGYRVSEALNTQLQFQATSARLVRWDTRYVARLARGLPGVPAVSGGGLVEYRRQLAGEMSLQVAAQVGYIGRSHVTFDAGSQRMGGYVTDRLSVDIRRNSWSAGAFIDNIANASRDTFAFGNPFSFGRTQQMTPQRPRTIGLRVSARL